MAITNEWSLWHDTLDHRTAGASGACTRACRIACGPAERSGAEAAGLQGLGRDAQDRDGPRASRCRDLPRRLHAQGRGSRQAAGDLRLQWRPRRRQRLPAPRGHRTEDDRDGRGRQLSRGPGASGREPRQLDPLHRPRLHRPGRHRLQPHAARARRQTTRRQALPRGRRRPRRHRWLHPPVADGQQALGLAEGHRGGKLWRAAGRGAVAHPGRAIRHQSELGSHAVAGVLSRTLRSALFPGGADDAAALAGGDRRPPRAEHDQERRRRPSRRSKTMR